MSFTPIRHISLLGILATVVFAMPGCGVLIGGGTAGVLLLIGELEQDPSDETVNLPPSVPTGTIVTSGDRRASIEVSYTLQDAEDQPADITVEYSTDSGGSWLPAAEETGGASQGVTNLTTSASGMAHTFVWDLQSDLPYTSDWNADVLVRFTPLDPAAALQGQSWTSAPSTVNVNNAPLATAITPVGLFPRKVTLQYILIDNETDDADVTIEYSLTGSAPWVAATRVTGEGEGITSLSAAPTGQVHAFVWDCKADLPALVNVSGVYLRVTPQDATASQFVGTAWVSDPLDNVNHNTAPAILGTTLNSVYSPSTTVAISYTLLDGESDPVDITVEYQKDGTGSWLPATEATSGSDGVDDLSASPLPGEPHVFVWDFSSEVTPDQTVAVRISIADGTFGNSIFTVPPTPWTSNSFQINASAGLHTSVVSIKTVPDPASDTVSITYTLVDDFSGAGHPVDVRVQYSTDGGTSWLPGTGSCTEAPWATESEGTTSLAADPDGEDHVFVWDSFADLNGADRPKPTLGQGVMIRITSIEYGNYADSPVFSLMNSWVATVSGGAGSTFRSPYHVALDSAGNVYVCDTLHSKIQVLNAQSTQQTLGGQTVEPYTLAVVAGTGVSGYNGDNRPGVQAALNLPRAVAVDNATPPNIYVSDTFNHRIRRIDGTTGYITTIAGTGTPGRKSDGELATLAELNTPSDIFFDASWNLWIADTDNNMVRVLNRQSTAVTFFQDMVNPGCMERIVGEKDAKSGYSGNGDHVNNDNIEMREPAGIAVDPSGNIYVCDTGNNRIRVGNATTGWIQIAGEWIEDDRFETVAGTGTKGYSGDGNAPDNANLSGPARGRLDSAGNIFFADAGNSRIRAIDVGSGTLVVGGVAFSADTIDTVAGGGTNTGDGIAATTAQFHTPQGIALDGLSPQNLYVVDTGSNRVRIVNSHPTNTLNNVATDQGSTISVGGGNIDTVAGAQAAGLHLVTPRGLALHGSTVYIADATLHRVFRLDLATRTLTVVTGNGTAGNGGDGGPATSAQVDSPSAVALDSTGNYLLIADTGNSLIRVVNLSGSPATPWNRSVAAGEIETLTSNPKGCQGIVVDHAGVAGLTNDAFLADTAQHYVRRMEWTNGNESIVAGNGTQGYQGDGAPATAARINNPSGLHIDSSGNIFLCDTDNHVIRRFTLGGNIATVVGSGTMGYNGDGLPPLSTDLAYPTGVTLDGSGNLLFVDQKNNILRRLSGGVVSIVCGTWSAGLNGDLKPGVNTQLNSPFHLVTDSTGAIYFSDANNRIVRRFHP